MKNVQFHLVITMALALFLACPMLFADIADIDIDTDSDTDSDNGDDDDDDEEDDGSCSVTYRSTSDFPAKLGLVAALVAFGLFIRRRSRP